MTPTAGRLDALAADLRKHSSVELHRDLPTRLLYSTDASNYQIMPLAVVLPRHDDDVLATVEACVALGLPILARGGGSSLAGQAVGEAVVIDFSRWLNGLMRVDGSRCRALVQPGITLDALNRRLTAYGLMVGPDPASADRATLGGIIANNSTGAHSLLYGMMSDHVVSLRAVLADGHETRLAPRSWPEARKLAAGDGFEAGLYRRLIDLVEVNAGLIDAQFPAYWRRSGGYNLNLLRRQLAADDFNPAPLLVGSEGTLGVILEAEINLVPAPRHKALAILHYPTADTAFGAVPGLLELHPAAIELLDAVLIGLTRASPTWSKRLNFVEGDPAAVYIVEFAADDERLLDSQLAALERYWQRHGGGQPLIPIRERAGQAQVWQVRKAGLGLLASMRGDAKPTPGIEDAAVPVEHLADYMADLARLLEGRGVASAMYAHASAGCLHVRPILNLKTAAGVQTLVELTTAVAALAKRYGGVPSSEHGDGLARSYLNPAFFGPTIYDLFRQVKAIFDPDNLFNPGKIVDGSVRSLTDGPARSPADGPAPDANLRFGPAYQTIPILPLWDWSTDGGFDRAVEMCNGAAICRKLDAGTMCPSFMALRDERHSTRGRANLLRSALTGQLPGGLADPALAEALDACLGCKACKSECPSSVDMTRLKAEVYAQNYRRPGARPPLSALAFGHIDRLSALAGRMPPLANFALAFAPTRWLLRRGLGLHPARSLPRFQRPFSQRPEARGAVAGPVARPVAFFADTFTEFNEPEQGLAALRVLKAAGFGVQVAPRRCCGRPLLSQGLVEEAKDRARAVIAALLPFARAGVPIVGLEPSCLLTLRDDYPSLIPGPETEAVAAGVFLLDDFLAQELVTGGLQWSLKPQRRRFLVHGHCHQKALAGIEPTLAVLNAIPGAQAEAIAAGCCGMAGAFGYTADHYDLSLAIANDRLLPAIRANPGAVLVANGFSCRQQIRDLTARPAFHLAQILDADDGDFYDTNRGKHR
ncbi:MAG: FAD-binding protein [Caldilineales bacterium]|nr:FAD-binding protein [Caldilineales bacterium]